MTTAVGAPDEPFEELFETIDQMTFVEILALWRAIRERFYDRYDRYDDE